MSGSTPDVQRLKKAYENNPYEAEQLLKECDIHSVAGTLKLYLRDLPESLFTSNVYQQLFDAYSSGTGNSNDPNEAVTLLLQYVSEVNVVILGCVDAHAVG